MEDSIAGVFDSLYDSDGAKEVTYGQPLLVSDKQTRTLVALSHLFPHRFAPAIDLIENGLCSKFEFNDRKIYVIENFPVALHSWSCCCGDFAHQLEMLTPQSEISKWKIVCRHLLAAYIIDCQFPILDYSLVSQRKVSLLELMDLYLGNVYRNA